MSQHKQVLVRGLALGIGFVGFWGFAIDAMQWHILTWLIAGATLLWIISYKKEKK